MISIERWLGVSPEVVAWATQARPDREAIAVALAEYAWTLRHDPPRCVAAAERAVAADPQGWRPLAELGNARRVSGDLAAARRRLDSALARAGDGAGPRARILSYATSLAKDAGDLERALEVGAAAHGEALRLGDAAMVVTVLVKLALVRLSRREHLLALRRYRQALDHTVYLDGRQRCHLYAHITNGMSVVTLEIGSNGYAPAEMFARARSLMANARDVIEALGQRKLLVDNVWIEGRIDLAEGDGSRAAQKLSEVARALEPTSEWEAALARLDLAAALMIAGRRRAGTVEATRAAIFFQTAEPRAEVTALTGAILAATMAQRQPRLDDVQRLASALR